MEGLSFIKASSTFRPNLVHSTRGSRLSVHVSGTLPINPRGSPRVGSPQSLKCRGSAWLAAASASSRIVAVRKRIVGMKALQSRKGKQPGKSQDKLVRADRGWSRVRPLVTSNQRRPARAPPRAPRPGRPLAFYLRPSLSLAGRACRELALLRVRPGLLVPPRFSSGSILCQSKPSYLVISNRHAWGRRLAATPPLPSPLLPKPRLRRGFGPC